MKMFPIKLPEGMLERWKRIAKERGLTVAEMVREATNRDIDEYEQRKPK